jgi:hypothetical protein
MGSRSPQLREQQAGGLGFGGRCLCTA